MRIGVLTAGGDAPGLNAAVKAIGESALRDGHEIIGIANGWAGLAKEFDGVHLTESDLRGVIGLGGTILGTARFNLDKPEGGRDAVLKAIDEHLDALIAIGGDGTQRITNWLSERGAPVIGVPKTLDNDLPGTDFCIGFDTAINIVAESLDRLHTTAISHHRVIVVETMGRSTGWVAALGGLAGGADLIMIPEYPVAMDQIMAHLERRRSAGIVYSLVVVAEGVDLASLGGIEPGEFSNEGISGVRHATRGVGPFVAAKIEELGDFEVRTTVLGHLQRGGSPSAHDRIFATRVGTAAYDAAVAGKFGMIPVVREDNVVLVPISSIATGKRKVPREIFDLCSSFF
jgi:ATP-dependent phosphofructokinase / diphosphate-dependent phosphofructokinase